MRRRPWEISICPWSLESIGAGLIACAATTLTNTSSAVWPSANLAIFVPFALDEPLIVAQMFTANGATAANSIDIGIYAPDGTLIVAMGSTLQSGTNTLQTFNITDTLIGPGDYYMAMAMNGTTGTISRGQFGAGPGAINGAFLGMAEQATAFALPATATLATYATANYIPMFGLTGRGVA